MRKSQATIDAADDLGENTLAAKPKKMPPTVTGHRFFLLFLFLLVYLIFYPYAETSARGYIFFRLLAAAITLFGVYAASLRRSLAIIAMALAIPTLLHRFSIIHNDTSAISIVNMCLTLAFDAFVIVVIFHRIFVRGRHDSEAIFGALTIYLMLGFSFANIYDLLARLQTHAFYLDPVTAVRAVPNHVDFIYYSFTTMTSLGAVGIAAVSDQARSLSVIESLLGLLYLAVLISRLMSAYASQTFRE